MDNNANIPLVTYTWGIPKVLQLGGAVHPTPPQDTY